MAQDALQKKLKDSLDKSILPRLQTAVSCDDKKMVLPKTFNNLTGAALTKLAPNVAGQLKQGTGATLSFGQDKTTAEIQASFVFKTTQLLNIGFNGSISGNASDIYTGKDGLATDWGAKASYSIPLRRALIYKSINTCDQLHLERDQYIDSLYTSILPHLDTNRSSLRQEIASLRKEITALRAKERDDKTLKELTTKKESLKKKLEQLEQRENIFGPGLYKGKKDVLLSDKTLRDLLEDYVEDSVVAFETRSAKWTGYNIWQLNLGGYYNRRNFTQFFPSAETYSDRFHDTAYGNTGINAGVSWYHSGPKTTQNFSVDLSLQKRSNFELPENKKYNLSFLMDSSYSTGVPNVTQSRTETKKAFDSTLLPFKTFTSFDINLQYTCFFGKNKVVGLNLANRLSFSGNYDNPQADLLAGPVFSVPDLNKEGSKLNFAIMFGYRDLANSKLTAREKRTVSFFVTVPFNVISFD
jgi:hypothetical protein